MTPKTLRQERIQKFESITLKWMSANGVFSRMSDEYKEHKAKELSEALADAAESRSEKKTDETQGAYHTAYNRGEQERPDKLSQYLQMLEAPGIKKAIKIDNALSYLAERLHRKTHTKEWETFAKQIVNDEQERGWKIEKFVDWLLSQENYKPEFWPVKKMMEFYPSAFAEAQQVKVAKIDDNGVPETY